MVWGFFNSSPSLHQAIKAETDGLREELEFVRTLGADLIFACGETEKPEVKKTIDEVRKKNATLIVFCVLLRVDPLTRRAASSSR